MTVGLYVCYSEEDIFKWYSSWIARLWWVLVLPYSIDVVSTPSNLLITPIQQNYLPWLNNDICAWNNGLTLPYGGINWKITYWDIHVESVSYKIKEGYRVELTESAFKYWKICICRISDSGCQIAYSYHWYHVTTEYKPKCTVMMMTDSIDTPMWHLDHSLHPCQLQTFCKTLNRKREKYVYVKGDYQRTLQKSTIWDVTIKYI